jgi:hypothetical protein
LLRRFFNASIFRLAEQQDAADGPFMGVKDVGFFPPLILGVREMGYRLKGNKWCILHIHALGTSLF